MGALARPHEGLKEDQREKKQEAYANSSSRVQECLVEALEGFGFSPELGMDIKGRLVQGARPAPTYPASRRGAVASVSGTDELAAPVSYGRGAKAAFSRWKRTGVRT